MNKNYVFGDVPVGKLFVTGPGDRLFIKVDNETALRNLPGGHAFDVAEGDRIWVPENRIVTQPTVRNFNAAKTRYFWERVCEKAQQAEDARVA